MCCNARREGIDYKIGHLVPCRLSNGREIHLPWYGFTREESRIPDGSTPVKIEWTSYQEKGREGIVDFKVSGNQAIQAYIVKNPKFPQGEGLFVVTRRATSVELLRCSHTRHPKLIQRSL